MKWKESGNYENPPVGNHAARLVKIIDIGTQVVSWQGENKQQRKIVFTWELPQAKMAGLYDPQKKGQPFLISKRYTASVSPQANLRQDLESWAGRKLSKQDIDKLNPRSLLGRTCMVNLIASEDGAYVNVDSLSPLPKGMECPPQVNSSVFFSLEPDEFDKQTFSMLPDKLREKITSSPEYRALFAPAQSEPVGTEEGPPPSDDDVPF